MYIALTCWADNYRSAKSASRASEEIQISVPSCSQEEPQISLYSFYTAQERRSSPLPPVGHNTVMKAPVSYTHLTLPTKRIV